MNAHRTLVVVAALFLVAACERAKTDSSERAAPIVPQPPPSATVHVRVQYGGDAAHSPLDGSSFLHNDASREVPQAKLLKGSGDCTGQGCTIVAKNVGQPFLLRDDATRLYWLAADARHADAGVGARADIMSIAKTGGEVVTLAAGAVHLDALATDLAANAGSAYWTERHGVYGVSGVGAQPFTVAGHEDSPASVAVDSDRILWLNFEGSCDDKLTCGTLVARPLRGGSTVTLSAKEYRPTSLLLDHGDAYWITTPMGSLEGRIVRFSPDTGHATTLATTGYGDGEGYWSGLTREDDYLYWYSNVEVPGEPAGVYRLSLQDKTRVLVEPGKFSGFTVKKGTIYTSKCLRDAGGCELSARLLRRDAAAAKPFYSGTASGLLADDNYLFWTDPDRGTVLRTNLLTLPATEAGTTDSAHPIESR